MSQTLSQLAVGVRYALRDLDPGQYAVETPLLYRTLVKHAQVMGEDARSIETWVTGLFSSTAGSLADVTFPAITNTHYQAVKEIRDPVNGRPLWRYSQAEIDAFRWGITSTTAGQGDPTGYALLEDASQVVTLRWDRVPTRAIAYDVLRRAVVPELYTDAAVIDFDAPMLRGIECAVALELYKGLQPDVRARLGVGPELLDEWDEIAKTAVRRERYRRDNLSGSSWGCGAVVGI